VFFLHLSFIAPTIAQGKIRRAFENLIFFNRFINFVLRHCATSWKIAGSIPDGFIGIFNLLNPSGRTMALGSIQPLKEMIISSNTLGFKGSQGVGLTTLPP
jgi:hypothetical protein